MYQDLKKEIPMTDITNVVFFNTEGKKSYYSYDCTAKSFKKYFLIDLSIT